MPAPDNPLVAKVAMLFTRDTRTFVNTFHVSNNAPWTAADLGILGAQAVDWWQDEYRTACGDDVSLVQVQVRKLDPDDPLAVDINVSPPIPGTVAGAPLPGSVTSTISWRTGFAGRKFRGRIYPPGYVEAQVADDDRLGSATVLSLAQAGAALIGRMISEGFSLTIFHKLTNTFTDVASAIVENIVDNQRRRLPGRGR